MSPLTFPNETSEYRAAREKLLQAEVELREQVSRVAAMRRELPLGGEANEDYAFEERVGDEVKAIHLSELFAEGKEALFLYSFMYGSEMEQACPMCSSFLDALDASVPLLDLRINVAAVAGSPAGRLADYVDRRGWRHLRVLSAAGSGYSRAYFGENETGGQMPMANVFVRRDGAIRHFWGSEMLYATLEGDPRHMDLMWPLWNVLDTVPEGRGESWYPPLWPRG